MRTVTRATLAALALFAGCDNKVPVVPEGARATKVPLVPVGARAAAAFVRARCEFDVRCKDEVDVASCLARTILVAETDAAIASGRIRVDWAAHSNCLRFIQNAPCTTAATREMQQVCRNWRVGTMRVGEACNSSSECAPPGQCSVEVCGAGRCFLSGPVRPGCSPSCPAGQYCRYDQGSPTCRLKAAEGFPCTYETDCPVHTYCSPLDRVCMPLAANGESCMVGQCASLGSECSFYGGICTPLRVLGEPCTDRACRSHLQCVNGVCQRRPEPGEPCTAPTASQGGQVISGEEPCRYGRCMNGTCPEFLTCPDAGP
jgi:hypothetical protein